MSIESIILIGGGGHCKSCIDIIEQTGRYEIQGILDLPDNFGKSVLGYSVVGGDEDIPSLPGTVENFFISIGHIRSPEKRIVVFEQLVKHNLKIPTIISPMAYVSKHAEIGLGTIVMSGAIVNADAVIGKNCIINSNSLIEHDTVIGDFCHVSTGAILNGGSHLGSNSFFGSNAVCKENSIIEENSFIKAKTLVK